MREFTAIDVEDQSIFAGILHDPLFSSRCVRPAGREGLHITLNFLGDVDPGINEILASGIDSVAGGVESYQVRFEGIGAFPAIDRPSVIWAGVADSGETGLLSGRLGECFRPMGLRMESREFHAHVTLARVKCSVDGRELSRFFSTWGKAEFGGQEVREVVLKKSDLTPAGPVYSQLHKSPLRT